MENKKPSKSLTGRVMCLKYFFVKLYRNLPFENTSFRKNAPFPSMTHIKILVPKSLPLVFANHSTVTEGVNAPTDVVAMIIWRSLVIEFVHTFFKLGPNAFEVVHHFKCFHGSIII